MELVALAGFGFLWSTRSCPRGVLRLRFFCHQVWGQCILTFMLVGAGDGDCGDQCATEGIREVGVRFNVNTCLPCRWDDGNSQ